MTLPLAPTPRLSAAATPVRVTLPPEPPDFDLAMRQFTSGTQGERDLTERELLGHAMGGEHGLAALRELKVREFSMPVNQRVAQVILDLADAGQPYDAAAVTEELRNRPLADFPTEESRLNTQLPRELDPKHIMGGRADPSTVGLGAWQTVRLASETRAPLCAVEIRAAHRRDLGMAAARQAWHAYNGSLDVDRAGRLVEDGVGLVTKDLADHLVSIPRPLTFPEAAACPSQDLHLPTPPTISPAGQAVLRRPA